MTATQRSGRAVMPANDRRGMSSRVRMHPAAIGAFAAGAVALAIAGTFVFGAAGKLFVRKFPVVMFFDDDVNGLAVGAQVAYRGIRLGQVTKIHSVVGSPRIAVAASLERGPFVSRDNPTGTSMDEIRKNMEEAIAQGLRAQLALQSLLTGQLYVNLVLRPDTPASLAKLEQRRARDPDHPDDHGAARSGLAERSRWPTCPSISTTRWRAAPGSSSPRTSRRRSRRSGPWSPTLRRCSGGSTRKPFRCSRPSGQTSDTARVSLVDITRRLDRVVTDLQVDASRLMTSLTDTSDTARGTVKDVGGDLQKTLARLTPEIAALAAKLQEASDTLRITLQKATPRSKASTARSPAIRPSVTS